LAMNQTACGVAGGLLLPIYCCRDWSGGSGDAFN
jgi:hypothetical protein